MSEAKEYLTSNRYVRYPFKDDTVLTRGGVRIDDDSSRTVLGCFVDAMIQMKDGVSYGDPVVSGISITGHTLSFNINAPGTAATTITCTRSKTMFPVISKEAEWGWYTFVLSSDGIREFEEHSELIGDISESELHFSSRCIGRPQSKVSCFEIYGGRRVNKDTGKRLSVSEALSEDPDTTVAGDVKFVPGYNCDISYNEASLYTDAGISFRATPGAGMGIAPCECDDHELVDTDVNTLGLFSSDGHVRLFNDTCYDVLPVKVSDEEGMLFLSVKCKACCTCDMYASIVNDRLIPLKNKILESRKDLNKAYNTYETNVNLWNNRLNTALKEDVVVTMTAVPLDAAATNVKGHVYGKMNRCGYSVTMRNDSFVTLSFRLERFSANGMAFQANLNYMDGDTPTVKPLDLQKDTSDPYIFSVDIQPGKSANLSYFLRLGNMVQTDSQSGFTSSVVISAYHDDELIAIKRESLSV